VNLPRYAWNDGRRQINDCLATPGCDPNQQAILYAVRPPAVANNAAARAAVSIPATIARDFAELPIPASKLHSQLDGFSLLHANTNLYADGSTHTLNTTVLGEPITVRVTPIRYRFDYGDGTSATTTSPGGPLPDDGFDTPTATGHVYEATGAFTINLTTTYTGEYSVNGGAYQPINGTATVASTPLDLDIWRTRHYQVKEPCTPGSTAPGCAGPIDD